MNLQEKLIPEYQGIIRGNRLGLYVHVPFCATTCDFCAFYQQEPTKRDIARYLNGVERDLEFYRPETSFDTVFWGGGTPGLLPASALEEVGGRCRPYVRVGAEFSVELAPALVNPVKCRALIAAGATRASLGVQSFDEQTLRGLGREHSPIQIRRAYEILREAGFASVSIDMMFAIPGQTLEAWKKDLEAAIELGADHISTYCLTFEEDTKLWVKLQQGQFKRDVEQEALLYTQTWQTLEAAGYAQYEVSNFARSGHACEHNVNTWNMQEWLGLGPSAASQYKLRRFTHTASLADWYAGINAGQPCYEDETELDARSLALDAVIFGLRKNEGIDLAKLRARFGEAVLGDDFFVTCAELSEEGLMIQDAEHLVLTHKGRLLADSIAVRVMEAWDE